MKRFEFALICLFVTSSNLLAFQPAIPEPEQHFGHRVGADRKLVSWQGIVDYLTLIGERSGRVNVRNLGDSTAGRPFLLLEISSEETIADLDKYKTIQQRLYFQDHQPGQDPGAVHSDAQRKEIFEQGKAVVLITCTIHATEVGAAQMSLELVHELATSGEPRIGNILDNVIFLLVPSLNPDGQAMVADWYNKWVGTDHEANPTPWLYHPFVGHDNNRDMYMYTQAETRHIGRVLYEEWFPSIWLDEHQMGSTGPRIFTMPATDPININVHPLIYRLNGVYGQAQSAALEAAGKTGIIYDYTYTNFWEGAMAWTGWWHNQVGMLTEVASVRLATPTEQRKARLGQPPSSSSADRRSMRRRMMEDPEAPLPAPRDVQPRTTYPRPWLGGKWTLRDIVDYELIVTYALLEAAANTRGRLNQQIYEINRSTIARFRKEEEQAAGEPGESSETGEGGQDADLLATGSPDAPYAAIVAAEQHDPLTVLKMLHLLDRAGVVVERAVGEFEAGGRLHPPGTFVIRLAQVFGRYAKDMLEPQTYPEVRQAPSLPPRPPYDVTAWSLGMQMGVEVEFVDKRFEASLERVVDWNPPPGALTGRGPFYVLDSAANDSYRVVNRLLARNTPLMRAASPIELGSEGGGKTLSAGSWVIPRASSALVEELARQTGLRIHSLSRLPDSELLVVRKPRIALYQPWGSNMDEGWTRWLLEDFAFDYTTLHPQDLRAAGAGDAEGHGIPAEVRSDWPPHVAGRAPAEVSGSPLSERFDVLVFAHQGGRDIVEGNDYKLIPPPYRGGLGEGGLKAVRDFVDAGGRVVALGSATELFIQNWPIPVRNLVAGLSQDQFLIPGSILKIQSDPTHPLAWGMPPESHGFFTRSPVFELTEGFSSHSPSVAVRYPNSALRVSGWTRGESRIRGRAAVVQIDIDGAGEIILFGLRPQHRAQTHATFKLFFNALLRAGK